MQNKLEHPENMLIIGFHGARGAGKTTACKGIDNKRYSIIASVEGYDHWTNICPRIYSFAQPIRSFINQFLIAPAHIDFEKLTTEEKEVPFFNGKSLRELMQTTGDFFRTLNPNYFNDYMSKNILMHDSTSVWGEDRYMNIILIDDVRYPEEADLIRSFGGFVFELEKLVYDDQTIRTITHSSDRPLLKHFIDNTFSYYFTETNALIEDMMELTCSKIRDKINGK